MEDNNNVMLEPEDDELGFFDKLVGVFTEPGETFKSVVNNDPKFSDWFFPLILAIIFGVALQFVIIQTPELKQKQIEVQMKEMQKSFQEQIDAGNITEEQAEAQMENIMKMMEENMVIGALFQAIIAFIAGFIFFFVFLAGLFFILKMLFKGEGSFAHAMSTYGLSQYLGILNSIAIVIAMIATGNLMNGLTVADFLGMEKTEITGFLLGKIEPLRWWYWAVVGLGFAKVHKSDSPGKYVIATLVIYFVFTIIMFFLAQKFSFLGYMI